jgi:hypothetical protein
MHVGDDMQLHSLLERSEGHHISSSPPCDLTSLAGDVSGLVFSVTVSDEGGSLLGVFAAECLLG